MKHTTHSFLSLLFILFLAAGIMVESTGKGGVLISYLINKEYIAVKLCENRANKSKHCNGKCYLTKQLKQHDKQEDSSAPAALLFHEEILMDIPEGGLPFAFYEEDETLQAAHAPFFYVSPLFNNIFHPPA